MNKIFKAYTIFVVFLWICGLFFAFFLDPWILLGVFLITIVGYYYFYSIIKKSEIKLEQASNGQVVKFSIWSMAIRYLVVALAAVVVGLISTPALIAYLLGVLGLKISVYGSYFV